MHFAFLLFSIGFWPKQTNLPWSGGAILTRHLKVKPKSNCSSPPKIRYFQIMTWRITILFPDSSNYLILLHQVKDRCAMKIFLYLNICICMQGCSFFARRGWLLCKCYFRQACKRRQSPILHFKEQLFLKPATIQRLDVWYEIENLIFLNVPIWKLRRTINGILGNPQGAASMCIRENISVVPVKAWKLFSENLTYYLLLIMDCFICIVSY